MSRMNFEEFKNVVVGGIREWLPESFKAASIELQTVSKNNDIRLTGLLIRRKDCNIAPTIYLDGFYQKYSNGEDMSSIMKQIAEIRVQHDSTRNYEIDSILDFEKAKEHIMPRLVFAESNQENMKKRPHILIEDLAVMFVIELGKYEEGEATIPLHYGIMEMWGVTVEQLFKIAVENLEKAECGTFISMNQVLASLTGDNELLENADGIPEDGMFILTNKNKVNGAGMVLDKHMMKSVIEKVGENFYMLPSSIHEWIIVPDKMEMNTEDLETMVREVNATQLQEEEILGNHVYHYTIENGLKIA